MAVTTGTAIFTATNIDDLLVLTVFFSQLSDSFRVKHVIVGQYMGILILVGLSLIGAYGASFIPHEWLGLLGLVPLYLGIKTAISSWRSSKENSSTKVAASNMEIGNIVNEPVAKGMLGGIFSAYILKVATVTIGNGGDNIGIYIPFFASNTLLKNIVILSVFAILITVWLFVSYKLVKNKWIANGLEKFGHILVPIVFTGLGIHILSGTIKYLF